MPDTKTSLNNLTEQKNEISVLYRITSSPMGENSAQLTLYVEEYKVVDTTPCGYWIEWHSKKKWVSKDGRSRFAYPTVEAALYNFKKRKERQRLILEYRAKEVGRVLSALKFDKVKMLNPNYNEI